MYKKLLLVACMASAAWSTHAQSQLDLAPQQSVNSSTINQPYLTETALINGLIAQQKHCNQKVYEHALNKPASACKELQKLEQQAFLGIQLHPRSKNSAKVQHAFENLPAQQAGLQANDRIVAINATKITSNYVLTNTLKMYKAGTVVTLRVLRGAEVLEIQTKLGSYSDNPVLQENVQTLEAHCSENDVMTKTIASADFIVAELNQNWLQLYPNPTTDYINVQFEGDATAITLQITDLTGKVLHSQQAKEFGKVFQAQLNVNDYPSGNYFISVQQGEQIYSKQFIIE
jgi:membrane-associated protease RseP (regulator of RpoE activity)